MSLSSDVYGQKLPIDCSTITMVPCLRTDHAMGGHCITNDRKRGSILVRSLCCDRLARSRSGRSVLMLRQSFYTAALSLINQKPKLGPTLPNWHVTCLPLMCCHLVTWWTQWPLDEVNVSRPLSLSLSLSLLLTDYKVSHLEWLHQIGSR